MFYYGNLLGIRKHAVNQDSYYVDSLMSKEDRDNNIDKFINDEHGIMNNVGILTTGFDCPDVAVS